jgi:hypothetical protein
MLPVGDANREFWRHGGLVWSNPQADDSVHIRAALLRPRFERLLEIALQVGDERLRSEWQLLKQEKSAEAERAQAPVERILNHIEKGFELAAAHRNKLEAQLAAEARCGWTSNAG